MCFVGVEEKMMMEEENLSFGERRHTLNSLPASERTMFEDDDKSMRSEVSEVEMRGKRYLKMIYEGLDGGEEDKVQRQDLLSLSTKVTDEVLLNTIRSNEWLNMLLKPEKWGKRLLKASKSNLISYGAFLTFWETFVQQHQGEEDDMEGVLLTGRRDTYGSFKSIDSSMSSLPPPNVEHDIPPLGSSSYSSTSRKILRALSVRSKSSSKTKDSGHEAKEHGKIHSSGSSVQSDSTTKKAKRRDIRVSILCSVSGYRSDIPQLFVVPKNLDDLLNSIYERFEINKNRDLGIIHSQYRSRITSVHDIRDGDNLEVCLEKHVALKLKPVTPVRKRAPTKKIEDKVQNEESKREEGPIHRKREKKETKTTSSSTTKEQPNVVNLRATFARRPSWKEYFDNVELPSVIKNTVQQLLDKISLSSNRWKEEFARLHQCPTESELVQRLDELNMSKSKSLNIEDVFHIIDMLEISFGVGKSHARVLFDAIDLEATGSISFPHLKEVLIMWRDTWEERHGISCLHAVKKQNQNQTLEKIEEKANKKLQRCMTADSLQQPLPPFCPKVSGATSHNNHICSKAESKGKRMQYARDLANDFSVQNRPKTAPMKKKRSKLVTRPSTPSSSRSTKATSPMAASGKKQRPGTAPSKLGKGKMQRYNFKLEEEFLRELHNAKEDDPQLMLDYAIFLLEKCRRNGTITVENNGSLAMDATLKRIDLAKNYLKNALNATNLDKFVAMRQNKPIPKVVASLRAEVICRLAEISQAFGDIDHARMLYHKAIQENPSSSEILTKYGVFLHWQNDLEGARQYLLEALVFDEYCIDALLGYAKLLSTSSDPIDQTEAEEYFQRSKALARSCGSIGKRSLPKDVCAKVLIQVGLFENVQGDHEEALDTLEAATKICPQLAEGWFELGRLRFALEQDPTGAVSCFENALKEDPEHVPSLLGLAQILANSATKSDVLRAESLFESALGLDPRNTHVRLSYAQYCGRILKLDKKAEKMFLDIIVEAPTEVQLECYFQLGELCQAKASRASTPSEAGPDRQKALEYYEQAVSYADHLGPSLVDSSSFRFSLAKAAFLDKQFDRSQYVLQESLRLFPDHVDSKWLLALIEQSQGRHEEAGKLFREAYDAAPNNGYVLVHFARYLLEFRGAPDAKKVQVATSMLHKALELPLTPVSRTNGNLYFDSFHAIGMVILGKLMCKSNDTQGDGLKLLSNAAELCPKAYEPLFTLADCVSQELFVKRNTIYPTGKENMKRVDKALKAFASASKLDEDSTVSPMKAGALLLLKSEMIPGSSKRNKAMKESLLEQGLQYCEMSIERLTRLVESRTTLSKMLVQLKNRLAEAHFICGITLERLGRMVDGITHYHSAIQINPDHVLCQFHIAIRKELDFQDLEGAEKICAHVLDFQPQTEREKLDQWILCEQIMKRYEAAEDFFLKSEGEISGGDPFAARTLVMHQHLASRAKELLVQ